MYFPELSWLVQHLVHLESSQSLTLYSATLDNLLHLPEKWSIEEQNRHARGMFTLAPEEAVAATVPDSRGFPESAGLEIWPFVAGFCDWPEVAGFVDWLALWDLDLESNSACLISLLTCSWFMNSNKIQKSVSRLGVLFWTAVECRSELRAKFSLWWWQSRAS